MTRRTLLPVLVLAGASAAQASFTVATFADPTTSAAEVMFTFDMAAKTLSGSWTVPGLKLETPGFVGGGAVDDTRFVFGPVSLVEVLPGQLYTMGAGSVQFYTTDPTTPFFTMTFNGGDFLNPFVAGASELRGFMVDFSGPNVPGGLSQEQFSFSFANMQMTGSKVTYTASFTSSAVPEPGTMLALGAGLAWFARRRRA